jgi:phosphoribosylanthranilate isomerase
VGFPAPSRMRVSVCGACNEADCAAIVSGGADSVGVIVFPRHRAEDAVDLDTAERLLQGVPPYVGRYAVTHAIDLEDLRKVAMLPIDTLQLHDVVAPEVASRLKREQPWLRLIKAFPVVPGTDPEVAQWTDLVDAILFDTADPESGRIGGTGKVHDWTVSAEYRELLEIPVVLAGGLRADNVLDAVQTVRPWALNLNTGVEIRGRKDPELVREFVALANSFAPEPSVDGIR